MSLKGVMVSSESMLWRSPPEILDPTREVAGPDGIGLDPCAGIASPVEADIEYALELGFDGLALPWTWQGFFYVNSPFGPHLKTWSNKVIGEADQGAEGIQLAPSRTGSEWCQSVLRRSDAHCFLKRRLKFLGAKDPAPFDCVVAYYGPRPTVFRRVFGPLGITESHPRRRASGVWHYELRLEMGDGKTRWQQSEALTYTKARDEMERWRARGHEVRLKEATNGV